MWFVGNRSGVVNAILLAAVFMAVAACGGGKEEGPGVAPDPTVSAAASSPAPAEPGANPTAKADAPVPSLTATTDVSTPAPAATNASLPTPTAAPASSSDREGQGFGGTVTLDGETYELWCPQENSDRAFDTAGLRRNVLVLECRKNIEDRTLRLVLHFSDYRVLDGPFEFTGGPEGANINVIGFLIDAQLSGRGTNVRHATQAGNLQAAKLSGTYDGGTGRVVGTFDAAFTASTGGPREGEGMVSGSFDLEITW